MSRDLIKRLIREAAVSIPRDVMVKSGVLFDLLNSKLDDYKKQTEGKGYNSPIIAFKDYFRLKDLKGSPLNVDIGLYNDDKDAGIGRMDTRTDTLLINLAFLSDDSVGFDNLIYHELTHAMDPLVRDVHIYGKYYSKKGAEPSGSVFVLSKAKDAKSEYEMNVNKYFKSQHEYLAHLSELVALLKPKVNTDYKFKLINWVVDTIFHYDNVNDVYFATKDEMLKVFNNEKDYWGFIRDYYGFIKALGSSDKIVKKFKNDLYKGLTK